MQARSKTPWFASLLVLASLVLAAPPAEAAEPAAERSIFDLDDVEDVTAPPAPTPQTEKPPATEPEETAPEPQPDEPAAVDPPAVTPPTPARPAKPRVIDVRPGSTGPGPTGPAAPPVARAAQRLPVPPPDVQAKALVQVKAQLKDEFRATGSERVTLARTLLDAGVAEEDASTRFVLLREARDVASSAGDARTGLAAARHIAGGYTVDLTEMGMAVLTTASRAATGADRAPDVAAVALTLLTRAADARQFDLALRIAGIAERSAKLMRSQPLVNNLQALARDLTARKNNADRLDAARAALEKNPADPGACAVMGRHLCLDEGNWEEGLPYLAKSNDAALKALAAKESPPPAGPASQFDLGTAWWTAAQAQTITAKLRMQERAAHWYTKAMPGLVAARRAEAAARVDGARKVLPEVVLLRLPTTADAGRSGRGRGAPAGPQQPKAARGKPPVKKVITESLAFDATDKPYLLQGRLEIAEKSKGVEITVGPGAEIRGGQIYLSTSGRMTVRGSAERPAVLRNVELSMDNGGSFDAEYAILDECTFTRGGIWWSYHSTKWTFRNCVMYKSRFASLEGVSYGFRMESCRFVGMTFPEAEHRRDPGKVFKHVDHLRRDWNRIRGCEFVDCVVPPTIAWCAEQSSFIGCKFVPGEAYEGDEEFEWAAFVADTVGPKPQAVFDSRPGKGAGVRVIGWDQAADVPRFGETLVPEITYATKAVLKDQ